MNRPLQRIFPTVGIITKWRVDWQRSLRSERNIVEGLGVGTGDLLHFVIGNSQIDSLYILGNLNQINIPHQVVDAIRFHVIIRNAIFKK